MGEELMRSYDVAVDVNALISNARELRARLKYAKCCRNVICEACASYDLCKSIRTLYEQLTEFIDTIEK